MKLRELIVLLVGLLKGEQFIILKRHPDLLATINTICAAINHKMVDTATEGFTITEDQARLFLDQQRQIEILLSELLEASGEEVYLVRSSQGEFKLISLPWATESVGFDAKFGANTAWRGWERLGRIYIGRAAGAFA
ncbi:MAG: hypothetical protein A2Z11_02135 [Candidatus Woykebacteria bacterium RBG_16_43_9]|uniref:Uncharacterized protein n=1 Tax=Candidatus Woykebacteria bacterium RBG_16_43_9 TaxID=1802596 RepID=A0A1G1WGB7_9BACT|nr:MAG: hypothetical protein A2Z11_02135 [Candidatus Woykebacteria bacterium RBG_16_43_9]